MTTEAKTKTWIMNCPHANTDCATCENSAAAFELRDLRRVARAAQDLVLRIRKDPASESGTSLLETMLEMARETSTFLPLGVPSPLNASHDTLSGVYEERNAAKNEVAILRESRGKDPKDHGGDDDCG